MVAPIVGADLSAPGTRGHRAPRWRDEWPAALGAAAAIALLLYLVRPVAVGPVGFDSAASVLHFDRIAAGQRLEAFITTTPKPLLTIVYGLIHALVPDWRAISLAAILAAGLAIFLAALVARRSLRQDSAWILFLALPLLSVGSVALVEDVAIAYALVWMLVGVGLAGMAAIGPRPRPWLTGLGLLLATLARLETGLITGLVAVLLLANVARRRPWRSPTGWDLRSLAIVVVVGGAALPVMLVHDWLLSGDAFFWTRVSAVYSAQATSIPSVRQVATKIVAIAWFRPVPTLLAAAGLWALWARGVRPTLVGLLALGPGVALFVLVLAARGTYVSDRYYASIELALAFAAAIGTWVVGGAVVRLVGARGPSIAAAGGRRAGEIAGLLIAVALIGCVIAGGPLAPLDRTARSALSHDRSYATIEDRSVVLVGNLLGNGRPRAGTPKPSTETTLLLVPGLLRPRYAVDLDLALWAVAGISPAAIAPETATLIPGGVVVHSAAFDSPKDAYAALETGRPVRLGAITLEPVSTPGPGVYVLEAR